MGFRKRVCEVQNLNSRMIQVVFDTWKNHRWRCNRYALAAVIHWVLNKISEVPLKVFVCRSKINFNFISSMFLCTLRKNHVVAISRDSHQSRESFLLAQAIKANKSANEESQLKNEIAVLIEHLNCWISHLLRAEAVAANVDVVPIGWCRNLAIVELMVWKLKTCDVTICTAVDVIVVCQS